MRQLKTTITLNLQHERGDKETSRRHSATIQSQGRLIHHHLDKMGVIQTMAQRVNRYVGVAVAAIRRDMGWNLFEWCMIKSVVSSDGDI